MPFYSENTIKWLLLGKGTHEACRQASSDQGPQLEFLKPRENPQNCLQMDYQVGRWEANGLSKLTIGDT